MTRTFAWTVSLLLFAACQAEPEGPTEPARALAEADAGPAVERPTIEFAGCRHLEPGSAGDPDEGGGLETCHLRAGEAETLWIWLDLQAEAEVRVLVDGAAIELEHAAVDGGQRLRVAVPAAAERLTVTGVEPAWREPFELRLARERTPAVVAASAELESKEAIELLEAALPELEGADRLAALQRLRRLLDAVDPRAALARAEEAAALARALGRSRDLADCAGAAAGTALMLGELSLAREWTLELERVADALPEARVWADYYGGALASRTGDIAHTVRALEQACAGAERLAMTSTLLTAREQLATVLAELGRGDEALQVSRQILAQIDAPEVACHDRARAMGNTAWIHLLLAEAGLPHDPPRALLERQLVAVTEGGECPDPFSPARVNLALVALSEHEPEEAREWISAQRAAGVPGYLKLWVEEISAQIGVASGREAWVPALVRRPDPGGPEPGLRWMAIVRHARTLAALGLREAAVASYLEAEAVLEETFHTVGVDFGGELFLAGRRASAEGLVELLVAGGELEQAFCRARLARGRALRTVDRAARIAGLSPAQRARREELLYGFLAAQDQLAAERREDWRYSAPQREHRERRREERAAEANALLDEALRIVGGPGGASRCEELPPIPAGVVTLLQFPRPEAEGGSWIFVADGEGVEVGLAPDLDPGRREAELAAALLEPFAERLAAARLIRIMPTGAGWSLPFHALPFADGVLLDVAPVVYALDLPPRQARAPRAAASEPGSERAPTAVIVANPSEDLPQARAEAEEVAARLDAAGWTVAHELEAEATRARLSEALAEARLLHYAGHGTHEGVDGWGAALLLHDGDRLAVADILALPRVPEAVVLSGCDTATVDEATVAGGMNLGRAFVLAGASWVIAAAGEVDDDLARAIGVALYDPPDPSQADPRDSFDGPAALRRAQLRLRDEHPDRWQSFRVVVP